MRQVNEKTLQAHTNSGRLAAPQGGECRAWYRLLTWNWRLTQKPFAVVCGVFAAVQLGVLLLTAGSRDRALLPFEALFLDSMAWLVFGCAYLAVLVVSVRPLLQTKYKTLYTITTLPVRRSTLVFSYIGNTAVALCGLVALQILLLALYYPPVMLLARQTSQQVYTDFSTPLVYSFPLSLARNPVARTLIPTSVPSVAVLLFLICAPSVLVPCAFLHTGGARAGAVFLGALGVPFCLRLAFYAFATSPMLVRAVLDFPAGSTNRLTDLYACAAFLAVLMGISYGWAVRSMTRARHL